MLFHGISGGHIQGIMEEMERRSKTESRLAKAGQMNGREAVREELDAGRGRGCQAQLGSGPEAGPGRAASRLARAKRAPHEPLTPSSRPGRALTSVPNSGAAGHGDGGCCVRPGRPGPDSLAGRTG